MHRCHQAGASFPPLFLREGPAVQQSSRGGVQLADGHRVPRVRRQSLRLPLRRARLRGLQGELQRAPGLTSGTVFISIITRENHTLVLFLKKKVLGLCVGFPVDNLWDNQQEFLNTLLFLLFLNFVFQNLAFFLLIVLLY